MFILHEDVSLGNVEAFTKEHIRRVRIGSVDVMIIDQEHAEFDSAFGLSPALKACIASGKTRVVLEEYFNPELRTNAEDIPVLGKAAGLLWKNTEEKQNTRVLFNDAVTEECRRAGKPIAVADIANKMSYMVDRFLPSLTALAAALPLATHNLALANLISAAIYMGGIEAYGQIMNKGIFDKNKIHEYERILLSAEDARRVYVAEGIKQLAHEYQPKEGETAMPDETRPQIVVIYPKAHARRIADYLENPSLAGKLSQVAKRIMYKTLPNLDFSVRIYEWKERLAKLIGNPSLANWQLVSNRPIRLFGN